jgi:hypothetical protein
VKCFRKFCFLMCNAFMVSSGDCGWVLMDGTGLSNYNGIWYVTALLLRLLFTSLHLTVWVPAHATFQSESHRKSHTLKFNKQFLQQDQWHEI